MNTPQKPNLNLAGAVDLSALATARQAQAASAQARAAAPEGAIFDAFETSFEATVVAKSQQGPVVVDFGSARSPQSAQMTALLETLVAEYGGRITLAKVDAEKNPRLVQAFQIQQLPAFFLVINGQVQPMFNGVVAEAQIRQLFEQIIKIAQEAGIVAPATEGEGPVEPPLDPRYQRAFDAIEQGDWDTATAAYNEALAANPGDADAKAGLIQVAFLRRATTLDLDKVLVDDMKSLADKLNRADALALTGNFVQAFDLLIDAIRTDIDDRDELKARLLDFFVLMGETPEVRDARRALTNALF